MSASGILRASNVIFYHPFDDKTEFTQNDVWGGSGNFVDGKISLAVSPILSSDILLGSKITAAAAEFNVIDAANPMGMTSLTDTLVIAAWAINVEPLGPDNGKCKAGVVNDLNIAWGDSIIFNPDNDTGHGRHRDVVRLTDDTFAIGYSHIISGVGFYIRIGTVESGTTNITLGEEYSIAAANPDGEFRICGIDEDRIFMFYRDSSTTHATARVATVTSGNIVTFGDALEYNDVTEPTSNGANSTIACVGLTPSSVLCVSNNSASQGEELSKVAILSGVSGNVINFGSGFVPGTMVGLHIDIAKVDSETVILSKTGTGAGDSSVGTISGVSGISWGGDTQYATGNISQVSAESLGSGNILLFYRNSAAVGFTKLGFISGTVLNFGDSTTLPGSPPKYQLPITHKLTSSKFMIGAINFDTLSDDKGDVDSWVGVLDVEASLSGLSGSGSYPTVSGATRISCSMWSSLLTSDFSTVVVGRGYEITMTKTTISLGGTTASWADAGIASLMASMNDGSQRFLVLDFENTSGNNWALNTSINGVPWVSQGEQNVGSQAVLTSDENPRLNISSGVGASQWIDELVMWAGDKDVFTQFTNDELSRVYELGNTLGVTMDQYGTPISDSFDMYTVGPLEFSGSMNLYTEGPIEFSGSMNLYTEGPFVHNENMNLFIQGSLIESDETPLRTINHLTKTDDHDPDLVAKFTADVNGVQIRIWDITDGVNTSRFFGFATRIGNTTSWRFSTSRIARAGTKGVYQYYFSMISTTNDEEFFGEFFLTVPEGVIEAFPDDQSSFLV